MFVHLPHTRTQTHTHTHTHTTCIHIRFVSMMPSRASFMAFSFLLRITEGIGTAMFATASYTQLTMFYLEKKGTIVVSCTFHYYKTSLHFLHLQLAFLYTYGTQQNRGTQAKMILILVKGIYFLTTTQKMQHFNVLFVPIQVI